MGVLLGWGGAAGGSWRLPLWPVQRVRWKPLPGLRRGSRREGQGRRGQRGRDLGRRWQGQRGQGRRGQGWRGQQGMGQRTHKLGRAFRLTTTPAKQGTMRQTAVAVAAR